MQIYYIHKQAALAHPRNLHEAYAWKHSSNISGSLHSECSEMLKQI